MIEPAFVQVLRLLDDRLADGKVVWALTGSLSFVLQGMPVAPKDIDVQTDRPGSFEIQIRCREFVCRPVAFSRKGNIRSYFGGLRIEGLDVDIIGDIQKLRPDGRWTPAPDLLCLRRFIAVEDLQVPVLPLAYEAESYSLMGRESRAAQLRDWLGQR